MSKIKGGMAAAVVILVVTEWLMVTHALDWGMSAVLPK